MTLISFIVPTMNEEKYIEKTLKSIRAQGFADNGEIIVVDSHSIDRTAEIARKFATKVIVTSKKGVSAARNLGAKVSRGKVLVFVDADTILLPGTVKHLLRKMSETGAVLIAAYALPDRYSLYNYLVYQLYDVFSAATVKLKKPLISGFFMMVERGAFMKVGGFNEELYFMEDFDLSKRISKVGKVIVEPTHLIYTSSRRIDYWGKINAGTIYLRLLVMNSLLRIRAGANLYPPIRN